MSQEQLFALGTPCFSLIQTEESAFQDLTMQLTRTQKGSIIRTIRGNKSKTLQSFFDECAASLQFPYYFGENWAAFDECITDLDWLEGNAYLLMINNASSLLCNAEPEDFGTLLRLFARANVEWLTPNVYLPRNRNPTPFHVVFECKAGRYAPICSTVEKVSYAFHLPLATEKQNVREEFKEGRDANCLMGTDSERHTSTIKKEPTTYHQKQLHAQTYSTV